ATSAIRIRRTRTLMVMVSPMVTRLTRTRLAMLLPIRTTRIRMMTVLPMVRKLTARGTISLARRILPVLRVIRTR
ncbi:hypothetical protein HMPREF0294_1172, partial [Corynebacterium glucuronolyticum ATCC 51867]